MTQVIATAAINHNVNVVGREDVMFCRYKSLLLVTNYIAVVTLSTP